MLWKAAVIVALVLLGLYLILVVVRRLVSIGKNERADRFFSVYKVAHDLASAVAGAAEEYCHHAELAPETGARRKRRLIINSALAFSRKKLDELSPEKQFLLALKEKADEAFYALGQAREAAEKRSSEECLTHLEACAQELARILASGNEIEITEALRAIETITAQANAIAEMGVEETPEQEDTYYEVLGIPRDASIELIDKAYRNLASKFHPDLFPQATEKFKAEMSERMSKINEAHEVLSDIEKKSAYDATIGGT